MKTSTKLFWTAANGLFVLIVGIVLGVGQAAQKTFLFSVMKDFEFSGILATNAVSAISTPAGKAMLQMNPIQGTHSIVIMICICWSFAATILIWAGIPKKPQMKNVR